MVMTIKMVTVGGDGDISYQCDFVIASLTKLPLLKNISVLTTTADASTTIPVNTTVVTSIDVL